MGLFNRAKTTRERQSGMLNAAMTKIKISKKQADGINKRSPILVKCMTIIV
jgi:hypothetical protein